MMRWREADPTGMFAVVCGERIEHGQYAGKSFRAVACVSEWMRGMSEMGVVDRLLESVCARLGGRAVAWEPVPRTVLRWWRRVDVDGTVLRVHFVARK